MEQKFYNDAFGEWKLVGEGGFGSVYKVKAVNMGHDVAIKLLSGG